jgi:hypothetical protein
MVVSSDSMKNATATSQGSSRLRESIGESGAGAGIGRSTLTFMKKIEAGARAPVSYTLYVMAARGPSAWRRGFRPESSRATIGMHAHAQVLSMVR